MNVKGIMKNGVWIDKPELVKEEFLAHFRDRFAAPEGHCLTLDIEFPNRLCLDQKLELDSDVSREEIKRAVRDCGSDKSHGRVFIWFLSSILGSH